MGLAMRLGRDTNVIGITPVSSGLSPEAATSFNGSNLDRVTLTTAAMSAQKVGGSTRMI
jgi:hypothetical protein